MASSGLPGQLVVFHVQVCRDFSPGSDLRALLYRLLFLNRVVPMKHVRVKSPRVHVSFTYLSLNNKLCLVVSTLKYYKW